MDTNHIRRTACARIPTTEGTFQLCHYIDTRDGKEHLALVMGQVEQQHSILVRVHSECFTGDVLGSQRCDCGEQLHQAMRMIAQAGQGVILYLRQEGRGIGLEEKLKAYNLQDQGYDTVDANLMLGHQADEREYSAAAAMLTDLGIQSIRLMTNNPAKLDHLTDLGVVIDGRQPMASTITKDNAAYLATKVQRMRHLLTLPLHPDSASTVEPTGVILPQLAELALRADAYFSQTHHPFVTLSYAQSLDGAIGAAGGGPLSVSGPAALRATHALRAQHDAILVGIGTLLADNPQLTVRLVEGPQPQPIIVDSHLRIPLDARIWQHPKRVWIATTVGDSPKARALQERGAQLLVVPPTATGQVDLSALFSQLSRHGISNIMAEGGAQIIRTLLSARLAHAAVVTISPRYLNGLRLADSPVQKTELGEVSYTQLGRDLMLWGYFAWSLTHHQWALPPLSVTSPTA